MLIGVHKRFVFVANTKTASTSVEKILGEHAEIMRGGSPMRKHIPLCQILVEYDFLFGQPEHAPDTYFKFGVMREPLDWIGSWFRYRKGNKVGNPLPPDMTFAEFWAQNRWNITRKDGSPNLQSDRFTAPDGTVLTDVIIPYHDLDAQFGAICTALGVKGALPQRNVSRISKIGEDVPAALADEIRAHYAPDYALLARLDEINASGMAKLHAQCGTAAQTEPQKYAP